MTCPSCQRLNRDDARFCDACGAALGAPPPPRGGPRDYTPRHLAEKILRSRGAIEGERKLVTVLFADVKGSMELAEQVDPEEWHRILDRFFQILADGVHRFEGTVNQYTGDGIMALFGAPIAHEDHAQRACYAALALTTDLRAYAQELRRELGLTFSVRMGINTGPVVVGKIGDDMRMDYTAQGHTVGLASRMEQLAEPGLAYVSEDTARRVEGYFDLEDLGEFKIKGTKAPVHAFALRGAGALRTRLDVSRARGFSVFVGRDEELARLESEAALALAGDGRALGVVAQAGSGKSRLCREFAERCRARGTRVLEAQALAHGRNLPLLPVLQILRGLCGVDEADEDQAVREKVAGRVVLLDETLRDSLPLLFDLLGVPDPARPLPDLDPAVRRHQVLSLITRLARASAHEHGLVLLIEDLHWVDEATEGVLGALASAAVDHRILLLVNFRPGYEAAWLDAPNYTELALLPLGADAMNVLTQHLLGDDSSLEPLLPLIRERAGGNPFFVEEIVRALATTGALEGVRGAYRLSAPITTLVVPESVQDLLAARIDQLGEAEKTVIQAASVIGRDFPAALLGQITSLREGELAGVLTTLRDAEFIYEEALYPEPRFAFTHALTQEVAYASQLRDRRLATHAQVGRILQDVEPEEQEERAALIAHHLEEAGDGAGAAPWRGRAARRAARANPDAAREHWRRVLELIDDEPEDEASAELLVDASINVLLLSFVAGVSTAEAMSVYYRGRAVAEAHGWNAAVSGLLAVYGLVTGTSTGDVAAYRRHAQEAFDIAQDTGDDGIVLISGLTLSTALTLARDYREAERVVQIAQRAGEAFGPQHAGQGGMVLHIEAVAAQIQALRGQPNEAVERLCELLPLARESGDLVVEMLIRQRRSMAGHQIGECPYLAEDARRVAELAERTAAPFLETNALVLSGILHFERGEYAEALRAFERTLELTEQTRTSVWDQPFHLGHIALCESALGNYERAHAAAVGGLERGRQMGSVQDWTLLCLTIVLLDHGDPATEDETRSAIDAFSDKIEECGYTSARPFVPEFRARLAELCNDVQTARSEWARAETQWRALGAATKAARAASAAERLA